MVLARSQYENMSREELIRELTDIESRFLNAKLSKNAKISIQN